MHLDQGINIVFIFTLQSIVLSHNVNDTFNG
jgi:hypothetical protein